MRGGDESIPRFIIWSSSQGLFKNYVIHSLSFVPSFSFTPKICSFAEPSVLELQELFSLSCHLQYPLHHLYHHSYNHWQDFHLISRLVSFSIWYVIWTAPSANLGVQDIKFMWWWFWGFWLGWNMEFCLELGFFWRFSFTINGRQIKIFHCSCTNWEVFLPTP